MITVSPREDEPGRSGQLSTLPGVRYSQSLERGLSILECFTPERPALGISEIAEELRISRPTTHRYATTLVALSFMEQVASRKYRLGSRSANLGISMLNSTGWREISRPFLEKLRRHTLYAASLSVLDGVEILYVERARGFMPGQYKVDLDLRVGSRLPAYCTAMGKVLLANVSEIEQRDLINRMTLSTYGPNTIGSKTALRAELEQVLESGMAISDEEMGEGVVSIACPVREEDGKVAAAIDLVAHVSMISLTDMVEQFALYLLAMADDISAQLGHRRGGEAIS